jgi:hypothetical protein
MSLDRSWYNNLVDDSGDGISGSVWDKADIKNLLDSVDAEFTRTVAPPVHCSLSRSTGGGQSVANNVWSVVIYDVVHYELPGPAGSMFTPGSGHIVVPTGKDGLYLATGAVTFATNATGVRSLTLYVNGALTGGRAAQEILTVAQGATLGVLQTAAVLYLPAGSSVQMVALQSSGAALQMGGFGPNATNTFQLTRLGPLT